MMSPLDCSNSPGLWSGAQRSRDDSAGAEGGIEGTGRRQAAVIQRFQAGAEWAGPDRARHLAPARDGRSEPHESSLLNGERPEQLHTRTAVRTTSARATTDVDHARTRSTRSPSGSSGRCRPGPGFGSVRAFLQVGHVCPKLLPGGAGSPPGSFARRAASRTPARSESCCQCCIICCGFGCPAGFSERLVQAARSARSQSSACRRSFARSASPSLSAPCPWPQPARAAAQAAL